MFGLHFNIKKPNSQFPNSYINKNTIIIRFCTSLNFVMQFSTLKIHQGKLPTTFRESSLKMLILGNVICYTKQHSQNDEEILCIFAWKKAECYTEWRRQFCNSFKHLLMSLSFEQMHPKSEKLNLGLIIFFFPCPL